MRTSVLFAALCGAVWSGLSGAGQDRGASLKVPGIPVDLAWVVPPASWSFSGGELIVMAGPKSDLFLDPRREYSVNNSPRALFQPAENFLLSGRVSVAFLADYDAGVLMIYGSDDRWAKLCFEYSPSKKPTVVSVVNNGLSDDANHAELESEEVFLRVAGLGKNTYAFHYSTDGRSWHLVRYFSLPSREGCRVGLSVQSPTGAGCRVVFSDVKYEVRKLTDIRSGE